MAYRIIAARADETLTWQQNSELIAAAKARVYASEGWQIQIIDDDGKEVDPAEFEALLT